MIKLMTIFSMAAMLALSNLSTQAMANSSDGERAKKPVWSVDCNNHVNPKKLTCNMRQTVFAGQSKTRIFSATIGEVGERNLLMLALPHGLNLLEGVKLSIDSGEVLKYPIHTADVNGAYAHIVLTDQMSKHMRAGNILSLNVMASSQSPIELQLSLAGFSTALDLLNSN